MASLWRHNWGGKSNLGVGLLCTEMIIVCKFHDPSIIGCRDPEGGSEEPPPSPVTVWPKKPSLNKVKFQRDDLKRYHEACLTCGKRKLKVYPFLSQTSNSRIPSNLATKILEYRSAWCSYKGVITYLLGVLFKVKPVLSGHPRGKLWRPLYTGCPPNTGLDR